MAILVVVFLHIIWRSTHSGRYIITTSRTVMLREMDIWDFLLGMILPHSDCILDTAMGILMDTAILKGR